MEKKDKNAFKFSQRQQEKKNMKYQIQFTFYASSIHTSVHITDKSIFIKLEILCKTSQTLFFFFLH